MLYRGLQAPKNNFELTPANAKAFKLNHNQITPSNEFVIVYAKDSKVRN